MTKDLFCARIIIGDGVCLQETVASRQYRTYAKGGIKGGINELYALASESHFRQYDLVSGAESLL